MQSRAARLGVLAAVIVAAVGLFIVLQNDSGDNGDDGAGGGGAGTTATKPAAVEVLTMNNGDPVGGVRTLTYDKGEVVRIEIRLNTPAEEVHVHGYEIEKPAETSPVRLSFPAKLDGIFEIELHKLDGTETEIAELRVNP
jgi:hypothetical protein